MREDKKMPRALTIRQLSQSGELLRVVTCPAGVVSVFRTSNPADLKPFQRALAGIQGVERFVIEIDREPYEPHQHLLIGYAENFSAHTATVREFMISCGAPDAGVEALLQGYDLERYVETRLSQLPPAEARMVRLLGAVHSKGQVLVLNDPFEQLSMHARERFAELIAAYAARESAIVIVPALGARPSAWIAHEAIHRVEISVDAHRTIGFSSHAPSEIKDIIDQVRAEVRSSETRRSEASFGAPIALAPPKAPSRPTAPAPRPIAVHAQAALPHSDTTQSFGQIAFPLLLLSVIKSPRTLFSRLQHPIKVPPLIAAITLATTTLAVIVLAKRAENTQRERSAPTEVAMGNLNSKNPQAPQPTPETVSVLPPDPTSADSLQPTQVAEVKNPPSPVEPVHAATTTSDRLLDQYPSAIKESLVKVFKGINPTLPNAQEVTETQVVAVENRAQKAGELLKLLENASNSESAKGGESTPTSSEPNYPPPFPAAQPADQQNQETMSWEERREMMRQRFLESIRAASAQ